ncbi:MAG: hypothetical protein ACRES9_02775 [Gammaproteobacteria bacterium]
MVVVGAVCILALGTMSANAVPAQPGRDVQTRTAVWLRIKFPNGGAHMAIAYDKALVTAIDGPSYTQSKIPGWGFRPIIQKDGSVKVKVYRVHFIKKDTSLKPGKHPQYLETLAPNPVATTTKPSDHGIQIKIMGTGPARKLAVELRQFQHIAQWNP